RQAEIPGEGNGCQADDDLVGEIDQHEEEKQGGHAPSPLEGPLLDGHLSITPNSPVGIGLSHIRRDRRWLVKERPPRDNLYKRERNDMTKILKTGRRAVLAGAAGFGAASLVAAGSVRAQNFPTGRVTLVVPFPPGASTDTTMRVIA